MGTRRCRARPGPGHHWMAGHGSRRLALSGAQAGHSVAQLVRIGGDAGHVGHHILRMGGMTWEAEER